VRRAIPVTLGFVGLLLLAAWVIPPSLDASRFRRTLEEISSEALGAPVRIKGTLAFSLLPLPTLTATQVSLGNGSETTLGAERLHLRVAPVPLLAGRFEALDVVLSGAELRLPWPPEAAALAAPWAHAFSTRVERSRIIIGTLDMRDLAADIAASGTGGLSVRGTARAMGQDWQFAAAMGAPAPSGEHDLELEAETRARTATSALRLAGRTGRDGRITAQASLRIADLSQFAAAPAIAMRAEGALVLSAHGIAAQDWSITLPNATARAGGTLVWKPSPSLNLHVAATRIDLDTWAALRRTRPLLPVSLDLAVEAATLGGGALRQLRGTLAWGDAGLSLRNGSAVLPGEAALALTGTIPATADTFTGKARLTAPDLRASLRWLESLFGLPFPAAPAGTLRSADLSMTVDANAGQIALTELQGRVDDTEASGSFALHRDQRPSLQADLTLGRLVLDPWFADAATSLPGLARQLAGRSAELRVRALEARLAGRSATNLVLDAGVADGRLTLRRFAANLQGARFEAAGSLAEDGRLQDAKLEMAAPTGVAFAAMLPPRWRATPALWDVPVNLRLDAAGPVDALSLRLMGDIGDLREDAQITLDSATGRWTGRVIARHPGAQRLFAALGISDPTYPGSLRAWAPAWPGQGSFALLAQGSGETGKLTLDQFDVTAGTLRGSGQVGIDWGGPLPVVTGRFLADALPLPWPPASPATPLPLPLLHGVRLSLQLGADAVLVDDNPVARQLTCTLAVTQGTLRLAPCAARVANGPASLEATIDATGETPRVAFDGRLEGAQVAAAEADDRPGLAEAYVDATIQAAAEGHSVATLLGNATGRLGLTAREPVLTGFDLSAIAAAFAQAESRSVTDTTAILRAALAAGRTRFDRLSLDAEFARGLLRIVRAEATGPPGGATLGGSVSLSDGSLALNLVLDPSGTGYPSPALRIAGHVGEPVTAPDLLAVLRWLADRPR